MRITQDNVEAFYLHCSDLKRNYINNDIEAVTRHACRALEVLGFTFKRDSTPTSKEGIEATTTEFMNYWGKNWRPYKKWLDYQSYSRDWFINAEIKECREKMKISLRPLTIYLLDIALATGKVYDK